MLPEYFPKSLMLTSSNGILLLTDLLWKMGGAERSLCLLADSLRNNEKKVVICCLMGGPLVDLLRHEGYKVVDLNVTKIYNTKGIIALRRLKGIVKSEKISVLLTYHESSDYLGAIVGLLAGIPVVSSRRDMGYKLKRRHVWLYRCINPFFSHIVTVSDAVRHRLVETQRVALSRVSVIHNGITFGNIDVKVLTGSMSAAKSSSVEKEVTVCCLANLRPIKGQDHLVESAAMVLREFQHARFLLVGGYDGNLDYQSSIVARIEHLGLADRILLLGAIEPSDTIRFLAGCDISVLPSLTEGLSNSILESMAAGLPVVATKVGGNPELVIDGETGYLVPPADPEAMADALLRLIRDPQLRREFGRRGRERVKEHFSLQVMVQKYEDVLGYAILKQKSGRMQLRPKAYASCIRRTLRCIKTPVASVLCGSGVNNVFVKARHSQGRGRVTILCFHNVLDDPRCGSVFSIDLAEGLFNEQLDFLPRHYRVVALEEAAELILSGSPLREDVVALTFDDCYKGFHRHVMPACRRLGLPFTVFLNTQPLDQGMPVLYDLLIYIAEKTWRKAADLSSIGLGVYLLDTPQAKKAFVEDVNRRLKYMRPKEQRKCLEQLMELFASSVDYKAMGEDLLTWDEVRDIDRSGGLIGGHSHTHSLLTKLDDDELEEEITINKQRIEEVLGHPVFVFSYPYGHEGAYDERVAAALKRNGYKYAFTLTQNRTNPSPFFIGRKNINCGHFADVRGRFHAPLYAINLSGLSDVAFPI